MSQYQNSPLNIRKSSGYSPQKIGNSINLTDRSKSRIKTQISPRKSQQNAYTVLHEDKLKVFVKFKPATTTNPRLINVTYIDDKEVEIERQSTNNKIYSYDKVFHENVSSSEVFNTTCMDVIDEILCEGKYGLIFVYGHTGTGKTYTMGLLDSVDDNSKGIVPESLRYIFKYGKNGNELMKISLSFNEIYMDEVYDMLDFEGQKKLQIREHQSTKQPYIQNNISISINTVQEGYQLLNIGLEKRRVGQQKINKRSSRGHGLITIHVQMANGKFSRLCFVDLAGSERIKQSESTGKTLTEAVHINTSLSALEALLMNIGQQSARVYRANKLTRLLQPFMESGKIRLIVTSNYQNIQPLQFAKRCKGIKFMERQAVETRVLCNSVNATHAGISQVGTSRIGVKDSKQFDKYKRSMEKLEQENKNLTQMLSNCLVLLNKISKLGCSLMEEQNVQSKFSFNGDLNLSMVGSELENQINDHINHLEEMEQEIIERCSEAILKNDKGTDDSINTSVSLHNHANFIKSSANNGQQTVNPELQNLINLISEPQLMNKKIHEVGYGIFQTIRHLANLSEYKNVYKKEIFTYGVKAQLLENKNKQFEGAINYLLKYSGENVHGGISKKVIKELRQMGVEINDNSQHNTHRSGPRKTVSNSVLSVNNKIKGMIKNNTGQTTKNIDMGVVTNGRVKTQQSCRNNITNNQTNGYKNHNEDDQLFGHQNNANNINRFSNEQYYRQKSNYSYNGVIVKKLDSKMNQSKPDGNLANELNKNTKRNMGTILIQDL